MLSEEWDNSAPGQDYGDQLALDPMDSVLLLTLRSPVCHAVPPSIQNRPVVEPDVTIVELLVKDDVTGRALRAHRGKTTKIEGKISENVWWRYKATMRLEVQTIY
jgi:hypothetical protein